jgi:hypothetical protein
MKPGLLEKVLTRCYGPPIPCIRDGLAAKSWNYAHPDEEALLYMGMKWEGKPSLRFSSLREIYGQASGGYLIKNALKVAVLTPRRIYGVWPMDEFQIQPEILHALTIDPGVDYFMDQYNVLFYGLKKGALYVFDSEMDEFDSLGPIETALERLMDELIAVGETV